MMHRKGTLITLMATILIGGGLAIAQEGDRPTRGGERGERNARGQMDQEQMRQRIEEGRRRMAEALKERLGASDEEWQVIEPRITEVTTLRMRAATAGRFGGRGAWGGRGGAEQAAEVPASAQRMRELRELLENEDASADAIQKALAAVREAREADQRELKTAQDKLREVLTARQEAVLVAQGILE